MRMSFVRCQACGAKALMAASQCPQCSEPLQLRDDYGNELPLSRCRACDTYYPRAAGSCRWCGTSASRARTPWLAVATVVVFLGGAVWGAGRYLNGRETHLTRSTLSGPVAIAAGEPSLSRAVQPVALVTASPAAPDSSVASRATEAAGARRAEASIAATATPIAPKPKPQAALGVVAPAPTTEASPLPVPTAAPDHWVGAVSTTWVNVRGHPSRDSAIVAVIKPESRVQLAQSRSAWTRVTAPGTSGWVDRRLFAVDSARPPQ
jgi:hypothetical protein